MPEQISYTYEFGPFCLDRDRRVFLRAGQVVPLTSKALDTLLALIENRSRVVEKDELLKLIWPNTVVEERNLAVNISTLRKVLGDSLESHEYIVTLPGRGYRFVAPVRELRGQTGIEKSSAGEADRAAESLPTPRQPVTWSRKGLIAASLLAAALIGAFALGQY